MKKTKRSRKKVKPTLYDIIEDWLENEWGTHVDSNSVDEIKGLESKIYDFFKRRK